MSAIRELTLTPPPGAWTAVELQEASAEDGAWVAVQARAAEPDPDGALIFRGPVLVAFRPQVEDGVYRALWVAPGGSRGGIAIGPVQQIGTASGATYGGRA